MTALADDDGNRALVRAETRLLRSLVTPDMTLLRPKPEVATLLDRAALVVVGEARTIPLDVTPVLCAELAEPVDELSCCVPVGKRRMLAVDEDAMVAEVSDVDWEARRAVPEETTVALSVVEDVPSVVT